MCFKNLIKIIAFSFLLLGFFSLHAEEGGEESTGETVHKKLPPEADFRKQTSILNTEMERMKTITEEIKVKIQEKNKSHSETEKKRLVNEIIKLHEELRKHTTLYNETHQKIKYRFPEKLDQSEREYLPLRTQTLEEIEAGIGLDADLNRITKKVEKKYAPFVPQDEALKQKAKSMELNENHDKKTARERIKLEQ